MVRRHRDGLLRKTREAWEERKRTLAGVDPMWKEARLFQWVQQHFPSFWTCSTEWRELVVDATCPVCGLGFGLRPGDDEEAEEEPVFVCGNPDCHAVLHKRCHQQARGTNDTCPGKPGCTSCLEGGFRPVYRYTGSGSAAGYKGLPQIRARAKGRGIPGWEHMKRTELVREIQNAEGMKACFGTRPDACPGNECEWRTNCIAAHNVDRIRSTGAAVPPKPSAKKTSEKKTSVLKKLKSMPSSASASPPAASALPPVDLTADEAPVSAADVVRSGANDGPVGVATAVVSSAGDVPEGDTARLPASDGPLIPRTSTVPKAWPVRAPPPPSVGPKGWAPVNQDPPPAEPAGWPSDTQGKEREPYRPIRGKPKTVPGLPAPWWKR
jgi:hypothetical protein